MNAELLEVLNSPAKFDALVVENPRAMLETLEPYRFDSQLLADRYALAAFFAGERELVRQIVDDDVLGRKVSVGFEVMLKAYLERYENVRYLEVHPENTDPVELEQACYAHHAVGTANLEVGLEVSAKSALRVAHVLAQALGLQNRLQVVKIDRLRADTVFGSPNAEALQHLRFEPMPRGRSQWLHVNIAEAFMAQGQYREALMHLPLPGESHEADDLRELLHFLIGLPLTAEQPIGAYSSIAHAGAKGDISLLTDITGVLETDYAALIEAWQMLKAAGTVQNTVRILGHRTLRPPDQATWRAILLIAAVARGAHIYSPSTLADPEQGFAARVGAGLEQLHANQEVIQTLRRLDPEMYMLLYMGAPIQGLSGQDFGSIGILRGQVMDYKGEEIVMPGRTGTVAVLKAMGLPHDDISRSERARFAERTNINAPVINLGTMHCACQRLSDASRSLGHRNEAAAWEGARKRIWGLMTPSVKEAASAYIK